MLKNHHFRQFLRILHVFSQIFLWEPQFCFDIIVNMSNKFDQMFKTAHGTINIYKIRYIQNMRYIRAQHGFLSKREIVNIQPRLQESNFCAKVVHIDHIKWCYNVQFNIFTQMAQYGPKVGPGVNFRFFEGYINFVLIC